MKHRACLTILACVVIAAWVCGCTSTQFSPVPSQPAAITTAAVPSNGSGKFSLQVDALAPGSVLPDVYACKGAMESPELSWENIPTGTKSLVLIVDDPDAPKGIFTHWLLYNIPPSSRRIDRAQTNTKVLADGTQQGDTSAGSRGYYPPCPPLGETHHYIFSLYALDYQIGMPTADRDGIDWAMSRHVIGQVQFITTFKR